MKKIILFIIMVAIFFSGINAQISIDVGDMPSVNDTIRISTALSPLIDYSTTGPNQNWDYSVLTQASQRVDTIQSVTSTGTTYALYFADIIINPNRANLAKYVGDQPSAPGITVTEAYTFFYKTSSVFKHVGNGGKLNGIETPVAFSPHDVIYNFPLDYNNQDSSNSGWTFTLPGVLFYAHTQKRVNHADGWGSLTTPYGAFQTLRIKSILTIKDSIKLDTAAIPFVFNSLITEHKWLGKQQDVPLLQINTQTQFGVPFVSLIEYQDSVQTTTGMEETVLKPVAVNAYPNPFNNYVNVEYVLTEPSPVKIEIMDMQGRMVYEQKFSDQSPGDYQYVIGGKGNLTGGTYLLKLITGKAEMAVRKLIYLE